MSGFGSVWHLAARFFGSLSPAGPSADDERWALERLSSGERALFARMSAPDRRHAIGVAKEAHRLAAAIDVPVPAPFSAAALLHDVGKVESRLGTFSRVVATLLGVLLGRRRVVAWAGTPTTGRWRRRIGDYLVHDRIGADLLAGAGSDELVVTWAREHHLPAARWSVDPQIGRFLKEADGD